MRINNSTSNYWSSSNVSLLLLLGLFLLGCSTRNDNQSYVAIRPGAEDDVWILKMRWNSLSHQISDTLYVLSPLIDNMKREEYSRDVELGRLFYKYQPHPIFLIEKKFRGDSILFRTAWFPIHDDSVMFHFQGIFLSDSTVGSLASSYYVHSTEKRNSDTTTVTFMKVKSNIK